jgi:LmbE family N-acetylglucosaminyl deacetylase
VTRDLSVPARALAIGAHADDVEFGCGATLAKWAAAGCEVSHVICTDGSKGSWNVDEDVTALIATRQDEQRAAAKALGASGAVRFLGAVDGELENDIRNRSTLARWIRELRPVVVLGHDPWKRWRLHPDHRAAGFLTVDAVVAARDPHFFRDHEIDHHRPEELLLFEADEPDHVEDVCGFADTKVDALLAHRSQWRSTHGIDDPSSTTGVERFRRAIADDLATHGAPHGLRHAEVFKRVIGV